MSVQIKTKWGYAKGHGFHADLEDAIEDACDLRIRADFNHLNDKFGDTMFITDTNGRTETCRFGCSPLVLMMDSPEDIQLKYDLARILIGSHWHERENCIEVAKVKGLELVNKTSRQILRELLNRNSDPKKV